MSSPSKRNIIIGTAGHVDHGKTELIRALTGAETDRLKEEKDRGISIDLGFAAFTLPSGQKAGVVDVPGHERFINNMLAGIGGIDLVLLVVDVNEGVMPQTHEHLQILKLLQIGRGIVVLTKCDLAEEDWIDIVEEEIREEVKDTFLKDAPFCRVSSITGEGIPELIKTIDQSAAAIVPKDSAGPLRLPIDRHFTVSGFGTIVTGTMLSGSVQAGDTIEVLPPGTNARIREVQVHGKKQDQALAGQRVALNLVGVDRHQIQRGTVVGTPGIFEQTQRIDARLSLLPDAPRSLKFRDPVHFYLGTARVVGLVALLDRDVLEPGESALVQIHLDRPLVAHRQDRFIIRSYSPMTTIGGGLIIDPSPEKHRRFRDEVMTALQELESGEKSFLLQKVTDQGCVRLKELEVLSGMGRDRIQDHLEALQASNHIVALADQWVTAETLRSWRLKMSESLEKYHEANPLLHGIPRATLKGLLPKNLTQKAYDQLLESLFQDGPFEAKEDLIRREGFVPSPSEKEAKEIAAIEEAYRQAGVQAKNRNEMLERMRLPSDRADMYLTYLFGTGQLIKLTEETFLHQQAYESALDALVEHFAENETLTLGQFRDKIGSARKQVQALLEYFDRLKYTMRRGDERVAWKLPAAPNEK